VCPHLSHKGKSIPHFVGCVWTEKVNLYSDYNHNMGAPSYSGRPAFQQKEKATTTCDELNTNLEMVLKIKWRCFWWWGVCFPGASPSPITNGHIKIQPESKYLTMRHLVWDYASNPGLCNTVEHALAVGGIMAQHVGAVCNQHLWSPAEYSRFDPHWHVAESSPVGVDILICWCMHLI